LKIQLTVDTDAGDEKALVRQLTLAIARRVGWRTAAIATFLQRDRRTVERRLVRWKIDAHAERAKARARKVRRPRSAPSAAAGVTAPTIIPGAGT